MWQFILNSGNSDDEPEFTDFALFHPIQDLPATLRLTSDNLLSRSHLLSMPRPTAIHSHALHICLVQLYVCQGVG